MSWPNICTRTRYIYRPLSDKISLPSLFFLTRLYFMVGDQGVCDRPAPLDSYQIMINSFLIILSKGLSKRWFQKGKQDKWPSLQ